MNLTSKCIAGVVLVTILGLFLSACGPTQAAEPCRLTTHGNNVYRIGIYDEVRTLYSQWVQNQGNPDPSILQPIKDRAFTLLVDQVRRWSSSVDIPTDDINFVRITLTYISPDLAQIIILNHQLYKNVLSEIEFENTLITRMSKIANREELIFLMTITYSQSNNQINPEINRVMLTIPMDGLVLTNSENRQVVVHSVDPHMRQEIVISRRSSSGYIAFPMGMGTAENCLPVIDWRYNTEINVSTRGIRINGVDDDLQLSWFFKYHPLLEIDDAIISSGRNYPATQEIPIDHQPPPPIQVTTVDTENDYWIRMALHVWGYLSDP